MISIGRYEIIKKLGQGSMGVVYKARDPWIDRNVAVKTINLQDLKTEEKKECKARFYQEARAVGRLSHRNIVAIHDLGEDSGMTYIAMELLEGYELDHLLKDGQRLPVEEALSVVIQVSAGLAYAHEHGIIHRDIKPSNIMVLNGNQVKIADFGIASMTASLLNTQIGKVLGSPLYMSPEQVLDRPIDNRLDIFSVGAMLFRMLTGLPPFWGDNTHAVMYKIVHENPPKPSFSNPDVPKQLDAIVAKCMAKNPDDRYPSAYELTDDLRACREILLNSKAGVDRRK